MKKENYLRCLEVPKGKIDVVLDTDAYNEIDDQFAIAYLLSMKEKVNIKGFTAAPFFNNRSTCALDGMEKSYEELKRLFAFAGRTDLIEKTYRGSDRYLENEQTPVISDAASFLAELSKEYSEEAPLYIVAIGAITNVASAFLMRPEMKDCTVVVWLGGHSHHFHITDEFNMRQDIAAARVIFDCGVPVVQLPCFGTVDHFLTTRPELEYWLKGKNPICDYLVENTIQEAESYAAGKPWSRVIWDVTAVAWLVNDDNRFMSSRIVESPIVGYDMKYSFDPDRHPICYVDIIYRDALFEDMVHGLTSL